MMLGHDTWVAIVGARIGEFWQIGRQVRTFMHKIVFDNIYARSVSCTKGYTTWIPLTVSRHDFSQNGSKLGALFANF